MAVFLDEILLHIFGYLDAPTLTRLSSVCKQWRNIAHTPSLWRRLILLRWPSQKFLFEKVSLSCVNWMKTYQDLWLRGNFSPDDMKYFISCRVTGDELTVTELREAMFLHMAEVMMKWDIPDLFEQDGARNAPNFNKSFELFFDTHDLKWTFIDKRREYIDDLFSCKLKTTKLQARYIRPYQVIPSCLMMFRWLCLFRTHVTDETGLTFYRIWRYRLKHRKTGLNFEVFDWKAAMSCTLSNGSPTTAAFREDAIELLNILTHSNFIMHPMGVSMFVEFGASPPDCIQRCNSATSSLSSCGLTSPQSPIKTFGEFSFDKRDFKARYKVASSTTDSDDESDGGYDTGYVTNCEDFISSNHWDVEEQHKIQAEVAGMWTVLQNDEVAHLVLNFDLNTGAWVFHDCIPTFPEFWIQGGAGLCLHYSNHKDHGCGIEPIPSCLALYRLVCLMNINARVYASMAEASIWALHLIHNTTRAVLHVKDLNGWFVVSVTLTEDMQNQLRKTKSAEKEISQWSEPNPLPIVDSFTQYVAGDEGSDEDDDETEDVTCETPTELFAEECYSSSESDVECDDLQEEFWLTRLTPEEMSKERLFDYEKGGIEEGACAIIENNHWQPDEAPLYQGLKHVSDVENPEGAWGIHVPCIDRTDDYTLDTDFEFAEVVPSLQEVNNPSDSDTSEVYGADFDHMSTFEQFKNDVRILLNLLMDEKFAHPYGTIAGSVA